MWLDGTFAHKFVLPIIAPPLLITGMVFIAKDEGVLWSLMFLPILIFFVWVFYTIAVPLKKIRVAGDGIEISNYRRRAVVPLRLVRRVEDVWPGHPWARRIVFSEPTIFGDSVVYLPRFRYGLFQRDWPELQNVQTS
jgi:hypothetical protein